MAQSTKAQESSTNGKLTIANPDGIHGFRYLDENLEFWNGINWIEVKTGVGRLAPLNVSNHAITASVLQFEINWSDSNNTEICKWSHTKLVHKIGSYPANETDGVLII